MVHVESRATGGRAGKLADAVNAVNAAAAIADAAKGGRGFPGLHRTFDVLVSSFASMPS